MSRGKRKKIALKRQKSDKLKNQLKKLLGSKSSGKRHLADDPEDRKGTNNEIIPNWKTLKELRDWKDKQDSEYLKKMQLDSASKLLGIGIRSTDEAEQFCELYNKICALKFVFAAAAKTNFKAQLQQNY